MGKLARIVSQLGWLSNETLIKTISNSHLNEGCVYVNEEKQFSSDIIPCKFA